MAKYLTWTTFWSASVVFALNIKLLHQTKMLLSIFGLWAVSFFLLGLWFACKCCCAWHCAKAGYTLDKSSVHTSLMWHQETMLSLNAREPPTITHYVRSLVIVHQTCYAACIQLELYSVTVRDFFFFFTVSEWVSVKQFKHFFEYICVTKNNTFHDRHIRHPVFVFIKLNITDMMWHDRWMVPQQPICFFFPVCLLLSCLREKKRPRCKPAYICSPYLFQPSNQVQSCLDMLICTEHTLNQREVLN